MKIQRFKVFAPVALAGIAGNLPATITTRAVTIHMRKRAPDEEVEPFEEEDAEQDAAPIRDGLSAWAALPATVDAVRVRPLLPAGVVDRAAEVWRPLVAVADAAGGEWPELARAACRAFVLDRGPEAVSLGVRLLGDLRGIFARLDADRLPSAELVRELTGIEDGPWADLYGKPVDARRLAKELGRYGISPSTFRLPAAGPVKGYRVAEDGLSDAWTRYLPALGGNSRNSGNSAGQSLIAFDRVTVTSVTAERDQDHVTDVTVTPDPATRPLTSGVTAVTDVTEESRSRPAIVRRLDGPCRGCGRPTQRYGPGGNTRCPDCRAAGPEDAA